MPLEDALFVTVGLVYLVVGAMLAGSGVRQLRLRRQPIAGTPRRAGPHPAESIARIGAGSAIAWGTVYTLIEYVVCIRSDLACHTLSEADSLATKPFLAFAVGCVVIVALLTAVRTWGDKRSD